MAPLPSSPQSTTRTMPEATTSHTPGTWTQLLAEAGDPVSSPGSSYAGSSVDSCAPSSLSSSYQNQIQPELSLALPRPTCEGLQQASGPSDTAQKKKGKAVSPKKGNVQSSKRPYSRRRDVDYVKRPPNAFILFRSHAIATQMKQEDYKHDLSNASRLASVLWNNLSEDNRKVWQDAAQKAKEEHQKRFPDYKYVPRKNNVRPESSEKSKNAQEADPAREQWARDTAARLISTTSGQDESDTTEEQSIIWQSATARRRQVAKQRSESLRAEKFAAEAQRVEAMRARILSKAQPSAYKATWTRYSAQTPSTPRHTEKLPTGPSALGRRTSAAGDLMTSVAFQQPLIVDSGSYSTQLLASRRSSSVPLVEDMQDGQFLDGLALDRSQDWDQDGGHGVSIQPGSASVNWVARQNPTASPLPSFVSTFGSTTPSRRKPAPPPIGLGPSDSHIARLHNLGCLLADTSSSNIAQDFWMSRPKTMASATPRSRYFQMADYALKDGRNGESSLISPMQRSSSGYSRPASAWQNWTRPEAVRPAILPNEYGEEQPDPTPRAMQTNFSAAAMPYGLVEPDGSSQVEGSSSQRLPAAEVYAAIPAVNYADERDMDCAPVLEDDVFAFSPDFLDTTGSVSQSIHGSSRAPSVGSTVDEDSDDMDAILTEEIIRSVHNSPTIDPRLTSPTLTQSMGQSVSPLLPSSGFQASKFRRYAEDLAPVQMRRRSETAPDPSMPPLPITPGAPPRSIFHPFGPLKSPAHRASSPIDMSPGAMDPPEVIRLRELLTLQHGRRNARALTGLQPRLKRRYRKRQGNTATEESSAAERPKQPEIKLLPVPLHAPTTPTELGDSNSC